VFKSARALKSNFLQQKDCSEYFTMHGLEKSITQDGHSRESDNACDNASINNGFQNLDNSTESIDFNINSELYNLKLKHIQSGYINLFDNNNVHKSKIHLLNILKKANAPLYLYDEIIEWTKKTINTCEIDFLSNDLCNRVNCIKNYRINLTFLV
jgi:hypothetical protein